MDVFDRNRLDQITQIEGQPCVSIYLPTHVAGKDGQQDEIRLKNLLNQAESQLAGHWMGTVAARDFVKTAREIPSDHEFWLGRSQGLAVFLSENMCEPIRLPISFTESAFVGSRFRIRPALPALDGNGEFCLLTLSQKKVAFYRATANSLDEVAVPELPKDMESALNYDPPTRSPQAHTASRSAVGKQSLVFHGQGAGANAQKNDLAAFCRLVDKAITKEIGNRQPNVPLILGCVDSVAPIYRSVNTHPQLAKQTVSGNLDNMNLSKLGEMAYAVAKPLLEKPVDTAVHEYNENANTEKTLDDAREIVLAAHQGRVNTLLYDPQANLFGSYYDKQAEVEISGNKADDDLVDLAALATLKNHGMVYSMRGHDLSTNSPLAALLRY